MIYSINFSNNYIHTQTHTCMYTHTHIYIYIYIHIIYIYIYISLILRYISLLIGAEGISAPSDTISADILMQDTTRGSSSDADEMSTG